jgi:inhibitor of KinA
MAPRLDVYWVSDSALGIDLGEKISPEVRRRVRAAYEGLRGLALEAVVNITPAYTTVLVTVDPLRVDEPDDLIGLAQRAVENAVARATESAPGRLVEIPVLYEGCVGPDLAEVAAIHGISVDEVVSMHTAPEYEVDFLGFSPGFAYLSGLDERLATPRLDSPRTRVPAGSVAIGGSQTGVYPQSTPGGWRIIGRTPVRMFEASRAEPSVLRMGDRVRFVPIDAARFAALEAAG